MASRSVLNFSRYALYGFVAFAKMLHIHGQGPAIQERLTEISQSGARNQQALSRYTWQEQQTISVKGEHKKTQQFQVRMGVDGGQQKFEINRQAPPPPRGGRLRQHIIQMKTSELQNYGQQIAALGQKYAQIDMPALQRAYQGGNISLQPLGQQGLLNLVIHGYLKPNDSVTLTFQQASKVLQSVRVNSYLSDPSDAVTVAVNFGRLPDGTSHVSTTRVEGVKKHLEVQIWNSAYIPVR